MSSVKIDTCEFNIRYEPKRITETIPRFKTTLPVITPAADISSAFNLDFSITDVRPLILL